MTLESRRSTRSVPPLPLWERSDCIVRCNPGEGLQSIDKPEPLTPTLSHRGRGGALPLLRHLTNASITQTLAIRSSEAEWNP